MYIVTGGAGFIGSAIIWALNQRGINDIIVVDELGADEKWKNLAPLRFNDYIEKNDFRRLIASGNPFPWEVTVVFHMGACSSTTETDASFLADNNYNCSKEVAEFVIRQQARLIYASSAATYGDGTMGYLDDEGSIDTLRPLNMYGYSKQMFDVWARNSGLFGKTAPVKVAGLKFTNVFGPNEWHKGDMRSLVCKAHEQILSTGRLKLFKSYKPEFGHGEQMRDFLYIKDAVKMVLFVMDNELTGLFNVGSGMPETWNTLAGAIFAALDKEPVIEYIGMPEHLIDKYQYYTKAEMGKLRAAGFSSPAGPIGKSVEDYVRNHLAHGRHLEP
ncbi:MAG: ADP-glyceromanno-heptose 6-epimerase [Victivallales bacterium]|nr:ADP-glyceromanno-heptose 6-epimerase [Victivallales bacterium]